MGTSRESLQVNHTLYIHSLADRRERQLAEQSREKELVLSHLSEGREIIWAWEKSLLKMVLQMMAAMCLPSGLFLSEHTMPQRRDSNTSSTPEILKLSNKSTPNSRNVWYTVLPLDAVEHNNNNNNTDVAEL